MNETDYSEDRATIAKLAYKLRESAGREGVYYILRFPTRWRLYAFGWDEFGDLWHGDVWRRYVVNDLVEAWADTVKTTAEQLKPWWKVSLADESNELAFRSTQFSTQMIFLKPESRGMVLNGHLS